MKAFRSQVVFGLVGVLAAGWASLGAKPHIDARYRQVNLVSDVAGTARFTDSNLVNAWGIALVPGGPIWISDNGTGLSTVYDRDGTPRTLIVTIPAPLGSTDPATPTGMIFNNGGAFAVTEGTNSASSTFIWATEDGTIAGWNRTVNPTNAVLAVDNSASGAVYKGIARASDSSSNEFVYVTNFHDGTVEKYDANFNFVSSFTDTSLPDGFAPFGIRNINGELFVTFALQDEDKHDDAAGPGNGFVDVFDADGNLVRQFAANGTLNSPWGLALAPSQFGNFSNALLVGNFGDGRINAFDAASGAFLGQLTDRRGNPITIDGLWGLDFGQLQRTPSQAGEHESAEAKMHEEKDKVLTTTVLYFTAGPAKESHGLFGFLTPAPGRHGRHHD